MSYGSPVKLTYRDWTKFLKVLFSTPLETGDNAGPLEESLSE